MAATDRKLAAAAAAGLVGGTLVAGQAQAVTLPEDRAEALFHLYDGGGTRASGPAVLVRKSLLDRVSVEGTYYVDAVSNASIDVVTTASPYRETRTEQDLAVDYVVRDTLLRVGGSRSREPDYLADTWSLDLTQDTFGGMTTVAFGFTAGSDKVGQKGTPGWIDKAQHWRYRLGLTQVLTSRWLASANLEAVDDTGDLASPYRLARVFGAWVHENLPRTRESHALKLGVVGDVTPAGAAHRSALRANYRAYWDTWGLRAGTTEVGYSRYFGQAWLADAFVRYHHQGGALFFSDDQQQPTLYFTRNRELSPFHDIDVGARLTYAFRNVPGHVDLRLTGAYEWLSFHYDRFTDVRTSRLYAFDARVVQAYLTATF